MLIISKKKNYKNILSEGTIWPDFGKYKQNLGTGGVKSQIRVLKGGKLGIRKEGFILVVAT